MPEELPRIRAHPDDDGRLRKGLAGRRAEVEDEPDDPPEDIIDVLADAEAIVNQAAPDIVAELDRSEAQRKPWWRRRRKRGGDDGDDFPVERPLRVTPRALRRQSVSLSTEPTALSDEKRRGVEIERMAGVAARHRQGTSGHRERSARPASTLRRP